MTDLFFILGIYASGSVIALIIARMIELEDLSRLTSEEIENSYCNEEYHKLREFYYSVVGAGSWYMVYRLFSLLYHNEFE